MMAALFLKPLLDVLNVETDTAVDFDKRNHAQPNPFADGAILEP